jgi:hypothetical protein
MKELTYTSTHPYAFMAQTCKTLMRPAIFWDITLRNVPEECRADQHRGGSLKSGKTLSIESYYVHP